MRDKLPITSTRIAARRTRIVTYSLSADSRPSPLQSKQPMKLVRVRPRVARVALPFAIAAAVVIAAVSTRAARDNGRGRSTLHPAAKAPAHAFSDVFDANVRPILSEICSECHNETTPLNINL